jgi:hypothetical protein
LRRDPALAAAGDEKLMASSSRARAAAAGTRALGEAGVLIALLLLLLLTAGGMVRWCDGGERVQIEVSEAGGGYEEKYPCRRDIFSDSSMTYRTLLASTFSPQKNDRQYGLRVRVCTSRMSLKALVLTFEPEMWFPGFKPLLSNGSTGKGWKNWQRLVTPPPHPTW